MAIEVLLLLDCGCELPWDVDTFTGGQPVEKGDYVWCDEHGRDSQVFEVIHT